MSGRSVEVMPTRKVVPIDRGPPKPAKPQYGGTAASAVGFMLFGLKLLASADRAIRM